jgi:hypothetical protein
MDEPPRLVRPVVAGCDAGAVDRMECLPMVLCRGEAHVEMAAAYEQLDLMQEK